MQSRDKKSSANISEIIQQITHETAAVLSHQNDDVKNSVKSASLTISNKASTSLEKINTLVKLYKWISDDGNYLDDEPDSTEMDSWGETSSLIAENRDALVEQLDKVNFLAMLFPESEQHRKKPNPKTEYKPNPKTEYKPNPKTEYKSNFSKVLRVLQTEEDKENIKSKNAALKLFREKRKAVIEEQQKNREPENSDTMQAITDSKTDKNYAEVSWGDDFGFSDDDVSESKHDDTSLYHSDPVFPAAHTVPPSPKLEHHTFHHIIELKADPTPQIANRNDGLGVQWHDSSSSMPGEEQPYPIKTRGLKWKTAYYALGAIAFLAAATAIVSFAAPAAILAALTVAGITAAISTAYIVGGVATGAGLLSAMGSYLALKKSFALPFTDNNDKLSNSDLTEQSEHKSESESESESEPESEFKFDPDSKSDNVPPSSLKEDTFQKAVEARRKLFYTASTDDEKSDNEQDSEFGDETYDAIPKNSSIRTPNNQKKADGLIIANNHFSMFYNPQAVTAEADRIGMKYNTKHVDNYDAWADDPESLGNRNSY